MEIKRHNLQVCGAPEFIYHHKGINSTGCAFSEIHLTEEGLQGVGVNTDILAGLDSSLWSGSDDGVETVLISSVVHPVDQTIRTDEGVASLHDHSLLAFSEVLQDTTLRVDLTIAQLRTVVIDTKRHGYINNSKG